MAYRYLIDVNLPRYFSIWNTEEYIHQCELGDDWPDVKIWDYAKQNNFVIITKDSDFSNRIMTHTPPPRVIHIRLGNMKMREFYDTLFKLWPQALNLIKDYKLVNIYSDRLEGIS